MDNGPPDPKRARLGSGSWSNGLPLQRSVLPPLGPPSQYPQAQPFSRPPPVSQAQGPLHHLEDRRHHEPEFPTPSQEQRPHSVAAHMHQSFGPPRDPVVKRGQSAEPIQLQYHRPHSTGDVNDGHVNSYPLDDPRRQNMPYDNVHPPPPSTQPYRPPPAYPPPLYTPANPSYERQPYEPPATPGGLREQIQLNIAYASTSGPNFNRRKAPRTSQVKYS
jgi:hypothetical protein